VERELERMRVLLARVGGRVARPRGPEGAGGGDKHDDDDDGSLFAGGDAAVVEAVEAGQRRKVGELLERL